MKDISTQQYARRQLIVNADDFGMSRGVNQGIVRAHRSGIVTSASLMVRWPAAEEAVELAADCPQLSLGLHLDLGEWAYRDGDWFCLYEVVASGDRDGVAREIKHQLGLFRELTGQDPTHLDSHQHAHREQPVSSLMIALARELAIPLRHFSPQVSYCGSFYGQSASGESCLDALTPAALIRTFHELPPGITELGCHPGEDHNLDTMYCRERSTEVETLCDPQVRDALSRLNIELCSFELLSTLQPGVAREAV
jgi:predicted glycoside hydrolase/deacetylase ChbG (UPF0249 family)